MREFDDKIILDKDIFFMREALKLAQSATESDDVPIGALIEFNGKIISTARNEVELQKDSTAHAEILAIRRAVEYIGYKHILEATLYVTLEPCIMCCGAAVLARLKSIVFGAYDPKAGACKSLYNICEDSRLNHRCEVRGGILEDESSLLLKIFFKELRLNK